MQFIFNFSSPYLYSNKLKCQYMAPILWRRCLQMPCCFSQCSKSLIIVHDRIESLPIYLALKVAIATLRWHLNRLLTSFNHIIIYLLDKINTKIIISANYSYYSRSNTSPSSQSPEIDKFINTKPWRQNNTHKNNLFHSLHKLKYLYT